MTTQTEALKLALEALESCDSDYDWDGDGDERQVDVYDRDKVNKAITAIKESLAQPEREPLEYWNAVEGWVKIDEVREHFDSVGCATIYKTAGEGRVPLSLCKAQPEREPVAVVEEVSHDGYLFKQVVWKVQPHGFDYGTKFYTTPPQRKPLTDDEIEKLECVYALWDDGESCTIMGIKDFARAIEAAHGIKE